MAYEVVKTIAGRQYRYSVRSERDPVSGKRRNRWTYLGRVASERPGVKPSAARGDTRRKLLTALGDLLDREDPASITADAIAAQAGVAHGTFYRYFSDRGAAIEAFADDLRVRHGVPEENLRDDVPTATAARAALRTWIVEKLRAASDRRTLIRTWFALMASDPRLAAARNERRAASLRRISEHFAALRARGISDLADPAATAAAIFAMLEGFMRGAILEGDGLDEAAIAAAADVTERAVFPR